MLFKAAMDAVVDKEGFVKKSVQIDDHEIVYLDRPTQDSNAEVIILMHGFTANKFGWLRFTPHIDPSLRVIAIDWAAHGESTYKDTGDYTLNAQVERLNTFLSKLNIPKAHLVGSSMGGAIAAIFASRYQDKVSTLTLMNSGGADDPNIDSEMEKGLKEGKMLLLVKEPKDFAAYNAFAMVKPITLPWPINNVMAEQAASRYDRYSNVFTQIIDGVEGMTSDYLAKVAAPTLILWGDKDRILGVENAKVFDEKIPNSKVIIYKNVGHVPMIEIPEQSANDINAFIKQH